MKRRPILIIFPNKFVENPKLSYERKIDKTLKTKIVIDKMFLNEFFEIFADHYKLYKIEGLVLPERFAEDTRKFIINNDPFNEWFESNIVKTDDKNDLFQS